MPKLQVYNGEEWVEIAKNGIPGKDANETHIVERIEKNIPILGTAIRDSLELLTGDERLDASAIKGLNKRVIEAVKKSPTASYFFGGNTSGGGGSGGVAVALTGNTDGVMATVSTGTLIFAGGNNITLSQNGNSVTISGANAGGAQTGVSAISAGTTQMTSGTAVFSNSNGVSFGVNGNTITASHNGLTTAMASNRGSDFVQANAVFNGTNASGTIASNNISVSVAPQTAFVFSNSNGVSFGTNGSTVTATVATNYQSQGAYLTTAMLSNAVTLSNINVSAGTTSGNISAMTFADGNGVSFGYNNGTITGSVAAAGGAQTGISGIEVSNTTYTSGTVTWRNANGISFGSSGANGISASYTVPSTAGLLSAINISAGTTSGNLSAVTFSNSNGITFGLNASTVTASHNGLTTQTVQTQSNVQGIIISNTTYRTGDVSFSNLNGISFGSNGANVITASYTVPTVTNSAWTVSDAATSGTVARLAFTNLNGITLSLSTGAAGSHTIVGSHNALTSQSNQNITAGNGGFAFQTLSFSNVNGVSFGTSAGSAITASVAAQTNQTIGLYASSQTTGQSSSSTVDARSITFVGQGNISVGLSNGSYIISQTGGGGGGAAVSLPANGASRTSGGAGYSNISSGTANFFGNNITMSQDGASITISANAPGAAAENNWFNALGANTAGNTTASGSTIGLSGINLTISGTNNSVFNLSVPATSSLVGSMGISISSNASTISIQKNWQSTYVPWLAFSTVSQTLAALGATSASARFFPIFLSDNVAFNELRVMHNLSYATSSVSGQQTVTYLYGLYTNNANSLSLISSSSFSLAVTNSSVSHTVSYPVSTGTGGYTYTTLAQTTTANIQSFWGTAAGGRPIGLQFGNSMTLTSGQYWLGVLLRHSSSSANIGVSIALGGNANALHNSLAGIGQASSAQTTNFSLRYPYQGLGAYTVSQSTLPNGVPLSAIAHTQTIRPLMSFLST